MSFQIVKNQLEQLKKKYLFDENGDSIIFHKVAKQYNDEVCVTFENYFITGFPGFDFHEKWNNGNAPKEKTMRGRIIKETEKMYFFELHSTSSDYFWNGWCPKKSCKVIK